MVRSTTNALLGYVGLLMVVVLPVDATMFRFGLEDVTFDDGGAVEGWFVYDSQQGSFREWRLTTGGPGDNKTFPKVTYTPVNSVVRRQGHPGRATSTNTFTIGDLAGARRDLRLTTIESLYGAREPLALSLGDEELPSVECKDDGPCRWIASGSFRDVTAVMSCQNAGRYDNAVAGTNGDDYLVGTPGSDILLGYHGNDVIDGRGGDDCLLGDLGDDILLGGPGRDVIHGGWGDDVLFGEGWRDVLHGGPGDDYMDGGAGSDIMLSGSGDDRLVGGDGDDFMRGAAGRDSMRGQGGTDHLIGGADFDRIWGGPDSDCLWGGTHNDRLRGGSAIDLCVGGEGFEDLERCEVEYLPACEPMKWADFSTHRQGKLRNGYFGYLGLWFALSNSHEVGHILGDDALLVTGELVAEFKPLASSLSVSVASRFAGPVRYTLSVYGAGGSGRLLAKRTVAVAQPPFRYFTIEVSNLSERAQRFVLVTEPASWAAINRIGFASRPAGGGYSILDFRGVTDQRSAPGPGPY